MEAGTINKEEVCTSASGRTQAVSYFHWAVQLNGVCTAEVHVFTAGSGSTQHPAAQRQPSWLPLYLCQMIKDTMIILLCGFVSHGIYQYSEDSQKIREPQ